MELVSLAERPDLMEPFTEVETSWPEFMLQAPTSALLDVALQRFPEYQLMLLDGGELIGYGHGVPFAWDGEPESLPAQGWDAIVGDALVEADAGREPTAVVMLEIAVVPGRQGEGLSGRIALGMRERAARAGLRDVVSPLRPSHKHLEPRTPMAEYAARRRDDGLPVDPWLRVHVRLGAEILRVCPASMAIAGSLAQWREWTGLPFLEPGEVEVPGALAPVLVSVAQDHAVYVEPNVWVRHRVQGCDDTP